MAMPQTNGQPESPVAVTGRPKPRKDDPNKPSHAPSPLILNMLRAGRRRRPCRRGNCMILQAPRRRRGRRTIAKLSNQEAIIKAYFKARGNNTVPLTTLPRPKPVYTYP